MAEEAPRAFADIDVAAEIISFFAEIRKWPTNFITNFKASFTNVSANQYLRVVIIVGAYCLFRPYIVKLGAYMQGKEFAKELEVDPKDKLARAKMSANELRGRVEELGDVSSGEDEEGDGKGKGESSGVGTGDVEFGKKARKRQRQILRKQLEEQERVRQEAEEELADKEAEEFLLKNSNWVGNPTPYALTLDD